MKRCGYLIMMIATAAMLAAGCSDDDPVQPETDPAPAPVATTPDSLMSLYRIAVEEMEIQGFVDLFHPDFRMAVSEWEGSTGKLPTDHMTRDETVLAAANMFGGKSVVNWQGDSLPVVTQ